jgi:hypothetical protein
MENEEKKQENGREKGGARHTRPATGHRPPFLALVSGRVSAAELKVKMS